jgi:hypothetical protein
MDRAQEQTASLIEFTEKDGGKFFLSPNALHHIQHDNRIQDPVGFIESVFRNPVAIVKSRWHPSRELYYAQVGNRYRTVVVDSEDRRIKTAYLSEKIKGGDIRWATPPFTN